MIKQKKWFSVEVLLESFTSGPPKNKGRLFRKNISLFERRVILVSADSCSKAKIVALKESRTYCSGDYLNVYGCKVKMKVRKIINVFELYDSPSTGVEVFSETKVVVGKRKKFPPEWMPETTADKYRPNFSNKLLNDKK